MYQLVLKWHLRIPRSENSNFVGAMLHISADHGKFQNMSS